MAPHAQTRILWRDGDSVEAAREAIARFGKVEVELPPGYHHTLFARLRPAGEAEHEPEVLDLRGGAELLERIAAIRGLEELEGLAALLREGRGEVELHSPGPVLILHTGTRP